MKAILVVLYIIIVAVIVALMEASTYGQNAPQTYMADTSIDIKLNPGDAAPATTNTTIMDQTFGSEILRVTDMQTNANMSFVSTDAGSHRGWNSNATAIKLTGPDGSGWWIEFNPATMRVGDGTPQAKLHPVPSQFKQTWEWSAVNPDIIYALTPGGQIVSLNKVTNVVTNINGPSNGDPVAYWAAVVGQDNWVCSAAGVGQQGSWSKIYCVQPNNPTSFKFIDVQAKTVNGVSQPTTNWPTAAGSSIIGIHGLSGGPGDRWLHVQFSNGSWSTGGNAVLDVATNTWTLLRDQFNGGDVWWAGHSALGSGLYANASGNSGANQDARGVVIRNPESLNQIIRYAGQPPPPFSWCIGEHLSWFNSQTNPTAPIFQSLFGRNCSQTWASEIIGITTDGSSNTVYRFAHNHNGYPGCYYGQAFAQISNDGRWVLFSSTWDGTLGDSPGFDCATRLDTFIVRLTSGDAPPPVPVLTWGQQPTQTVTGMAFAPAMSGTLTPAAAHSLTASVTAGGCTLGGTPTTMSDGTTGAWSFPGVTVTRATPGTCQITITDITNNQVVALVSGGFNVIAQVDIVTMSVNSGPCVLTPAMPMAPVINNAFSFPGVTVDSPTLPATCTLKFTHSDQTIPAEFSDPFTITDTAPVVPVLAFVQPPTNTQTGNVMTPNMSGSLIPASVRTLTMTVTPGNCGVSGNQTVQTLTNGNWSFPNLTFSATGTLPQVCSVTIRDTSNVNPAASINADFTITPPPTPTLVFLSQPQSTQSGQTIPTFTVGVILVSPTGSRLARSGVVTLSEETGCGASFTNYTAALNGSGTGTATFNAMATIGTGTNCQFTATMPGATSAVSAFFNVTAMPPPTLVRAVVPRGAP